MRTTAAFLAIAPVEPRHSPIMTRAQHSAYWHYAQQDVLELTVLTIDTFLAIVPAQPRHPDIMTMIYRTRKYCMQADQARERAKRHEYLASALMPRVFPTRSRRPVQFHIFIRCALLSMQNPQHSFATGSLAVTFWHCASGSSNGFPRLHMDVYDEKIAH